MAKIVHTGDIHLDSAFTSLSPEDARIRRSTLRTHVSTVINTANDENADAIIIAGDLFDSYPIRPETEESLISDFSRAKMPIFITPGNHDPYTPDSPYKTVNFPDNVFIFSSSDLTPIELPDKKIRIFGAAYISEIFDERILSDIKVPNDDYINIVALHSNLYTAGYSPISESEIAECGADYVAIAHVHKPTGLLKSGNTHFAYCGCLEPRDFGEPYDGGFLIVDVSKEKVSANRKIVSDIYYRELTINIEGHSDILSALPTPKKREHLRLTICGESDSVNIENLYDILSPLYEELIITDNTTAPRNIWLGIEEDTLRGVFLRQIKAQLENCEDEMEKEKLRLAARFGIDAIENRDV